MRGWAFLFLAGLAVNAATADPTTDYRNATAVLRKHSSGLGHDGTPQGDAALNNLWSAGGKWAANYIDLHPDVTAAQFGIAAERLKIGASALQLTASTWIVSLSEGETGTIAILAKRNGHFRKVWRIDEDRADYLKFPALRGWSTKAAGPCRAPYREEVGDTACGPLYGGPIRLPDDDHGAARFAIDANYGEEAGAAVGSQFTIWSWDGQRAKPLYLKGYVRPLEGMENSFDGRSYHLEERTEYRSAFVTAPEIGHQMNTTIQITGTGVVPLEPLPANPDIDFVDRLLADAIEGKTVSPRMSVDSARSLKSILASKSPYDKSFAPLGELFGSGTTPAINGVWVCFSTDKLGELNFLLQKEAGKRFVTRIAEGPIPEVRKCGFGLP